MTPANDPTLPKPWMLMVEPSRSKFLSFAHSVMQCTRPCPVALSRPSVPPDATGLPVTTPFTLCLFTMPTVFMYVSMAQAMVCALVPMSGAGMS